jgi:hypothetical protein
MAIFYLSADVKGSGQILHSNSMTATSQVTMSYNGFSTYGYSRTALHQGNTSMAAGMIGNCITNNCYQAAFVKDCALLST